MRASIRQARRSERKTIVLGMEANREAFPGLKLPARRRSGGPAEFSQDQMSEKDHFYVCAAAFEFCNLLPFLEISGTVSLRGVLLPGHRRLQ